VILFQQFTHKLKIGFMPSLQANIEKTNSTLSQAAE